MEFKTFPNGVKTPVLGFGTWGMGGGVSPDNSNDEPEIKAIKHAISLGMTHIDTAEYYGKGHAEELVGEAIKGFDRKKLFITSKVWSTHLSYDSVLKSAEQSLKRMQLDCMDLYLIHWPNHSFPMKETMRAMNELVKNGKIKSVGVSNFSVKEMKDAQKYCSTPIMTNQVQYSLLHRAPEEDGVLDYCWKNSIILTAYTPLEKGQLARPGYKILDETAKKYKKTQAQVALRWLIQKKPVIAIPKAVNLKSIDDNAGALGWKLDEKDVKKLDEGF